MPRPEEDGPRIRIEPARRRVRALLGGETIADSEHAVLLLERGHVPVYYFPRADVRTERLQPTDHASHCPWKGDACYWTVKAGRREVENAAWSYPAPAQGAPDLSSLIAFYWDRMDAWFEEDEEVFVHPRDPYTRVDVLASSREVEVVVAGEVVAATRRPLLLLETGHPPRYYIPKADARLDLMVPSALRTRCPYKGEARYYSVRTAGALVEDVAWYYPYPVAACAGIANCLCFYDDRVEALRVDGEVPARR